MILMKVYNNKDKELIIKILKLATDAVNKYCEEKHLSGQDKEDIYYLSSAYLYPHMLNDIENNIIDDDLIMTMFGLINWSSYNEYINNKEYWSLRLMLKVDP